MTVSIEEQISAKNFYDSAVLFCKKAESLSNAACIHPSDLTLRIMHIYSAAMHLPNTEPSTWQANEIPTSPDISFGNRDCYWEIYDPFVLEEPVCGSLSDDLRSIFVDLSKGIILYEQGHIADALWAWRFDFRNHWSFHAVDAIRVLNSITMEEGDNEHI